MNNVNHSYNFSNCLYADEDFLNQISSHFFSEPWTKLPPVNHITGTQT